MVVGVVVCLLRSLQRPSPSHYLISYYYSLTCLCPVVVLQIIINPTDSAFTEID